MSEEELLEALKIMTKPLTVEQIKNFKYTFFDNSGDEESFTLENYLDLSNTVYDLERENQQLEADLTKEELSYINLRDTFNKKCSECDLYKSVIDEVREYIKHSWWLRTDQVYDTSKDLQGWEVEKILEILDKAKGSDKGE